jgi:hypothetical protein
MNECRGASAGFYGPLFIHRPTYKYIARHSCGLEVRELQHVTLGSIMILIFYFYIGNLLIAGIVYSLMIG